MKTYVSTGKVGPGLIAMWMGAAIGMAVGGAVHAAGSYYNPFLMIDFLLIVLAGGGVFALTKWAVSAAKCRNAMMGSLVGFTGAVVWVLASHAALFWLIARTAPPGTNPTFMEYVSFRMQTGWTIGKHGTGIPITGWGVVAVWAVEAGSLLFVGWTGGREAARKPFCEACDTWANKELHEFSMPGLTPERMKEMGQAMTLEQILTPPLGEIKESNRMLVYRVHGCPKCEKVGFLDLIDRTLTIDKNGEAKPKDREVGSRIVLSSDEVEAVGELKTDVHEITMKGRLPK